MQLNLVHCWLYLGIGEDIQESLAACVGDADGLGEAFLHEALHLAPDFVHGRTLHLVLLVVDHGEPPVNQVQVDVLQVQLLQGISQGSLRVLVSRPPQLGRHKDVLSLDGARLEDFLESSTYLLLVLIDGGLVDGSVAVLENRRLHQGSEGVSGGLEGAKTDLGHLCTRVQEDVGKSL